MSHALSLVNARASARSSLMRGSRRQRDLRRRWTSGKKMVAAGRSCGRGAAARRRDSAAAKISPARQGLGTGSAPSRVRMPEAGDGAIDEIQGGRRELQGRSLAGSRRTQRRRVRGSAGNIAGQRDLSSSLTRGLHGGQVHLRERGEKFETGERRGTTRRRKSTGKRRRYGMVAAACRRRRGRGRGGCRRRGWWIER